MALQFPRSLYTAAQGESNNWAPSPANGDEENNVENGVTYYYTYNTQYQQQSDQSYLARWVLNSGTVWSVPNGGATYTWDGVKWTASNIPDHSRAVFSDDADGDGVTDGKVLKWSQSANQWVAADDNNTQLTTEEVQDIVGDMATGNSDTAGITVTYVDGNDNGTGTLKFVVDSQTDNNFTNTLKTKLDGIEASANNYSLTVKNDDDSLQTGATTLKFTGTGVTAGGAGAEKTITITDTNYSDFTTSTDDAVGTAGLVPAPAAGDYTNKFLKANGSWEVPPDTTYNTVSTDAAGLAPELPDEHEGKFLRADGSWVVPPDNNTTYNDFSEAQNAQTDGTAGLVPAPPAATYNTDSFLKADGTWAVPPDTNTDTNTTYSLSVPLNTTTIKLEPSSGTANNIAISGGTDINVERAQNGGLTISSTAGGIASVLADTTPQLGGNLDVNGKKIVTDSSNENVVIAPHGTGALNVSSSKIINVTNPTENQDAATKAYVDTQVASAGGGGATDLGIGTRTTTTVPVTSSTGTNADIPAATTSLAGVMSADDKTKLNGISAGADVTNTSNVAVAGAAMKTGAVFSGTVDFDKNVTQDAKAVPSNNVINCSTGNYFTKTINGNSVFSVSNVPFGGTAYYFTLELRHNSGTVTWWSQLKWPGDTAPTLTANKTHLFVFVTDDGGNRWRGASLLAYPH